MYNKSYNIEIMLFVNWLMEKFENFIAASLYVFCGNGAVLL